MCGLVGMAGKLEVKHEKAFRDMLTVCQVRGRDSTGAIAVRNNNDVHWAKQVGPPEFLLDTRTFDREITTGFNKVFMGHTRSKTVGEATVRNAHPFDFSRIIGMHNGTLRYEHSMERRREFQVDSEWLYWFINEYGIEEAIPQIEGAWALTWWDKQDNTLNFLRNDERPLWLTYTKDMKVLMWASEPWFFSAAERLIDLWDGDGGPVCFPIKINQHLAFKIDSTGTEPPKIFQMAPPKELKGKEVRRYTGNWAGNRWQEHRDRNSTTTSATSGSSGGTASGVSVDGGGEVADPFLDGVLGEGEQGTLYLTPRQRQERQEALDRRKQLAASTTTSSHSTTSEQKSSNGSASQTGQSSSTGSSVVTVSPPTSTSRLPAPTSNVVSLKDSVKGRRVSERTLSLKLSQQQPQPALLPQRRHQKPLVDRRTVAGVHYITDCVSGIEFEESEFRHLVGNQCVYCKSVDQPLAKVHHIFAPKVSGGKPDKVTYLCTDCLTDEDD